MIDLIIIVENGRVTDVLSYTCLLYTSRCV